MFRFAMIAATALGLAHTPAAADETLLTAPGQTATLTGGAVEMMATYRPTDWDTFEVTAIFAASGWTNEPMRVRMAMQDGDRVAFSIPGYPDQLFRFSRGGAALAASVEEIEFVEIAQIQ